MSSVNKVILIGHLGADPEMRYTSAGKPRCKLSVATNRRWTDGEGQKKEETAWHRVTVFGRQAENCQAYLHKGQQAYIEGRLQRSSYLDKEGVKRYSTDIIAVRVVFLGSKGMASAGLEPPHAADNTNFQGDNLPF